MARSFFVLLSAFLLAGCSLLQPTPREAIAFARAVYVVDEAPIIGLVERELGGVDTLREGGFSALFAIGDSLFAVTDRGPNISAAKRAGGGPAPRIFPIPDYSPSLYRLELGASGGTSADGQQLGRATLIDPVEIRNGGGGPTSGRPLPVYSAVKGAYEVGWADAEGALLATDPWGLDVEGAVEGSPGKPARHGLPSEPATFWAADEYRPAILEIERTSGRTLRRFTALLADATFDQPLDEVLGLRHPNYGLEGLTRLDDGRLIAAMQAPIPNPDAASTAESRLVRFLLFDPKTGVSNTLAYALDRKGHFVSDLSAARGSQMLVLEHDSRGRGWVYAVDLSRASLVLESYDGRTMEQLTDEADVEAAGLRPVPKRLVLDLRASGWDPAAGKPEGLATLGARTLALINDNDYAIDAPLADGSYALTTRPTTLYTFRLPVPLWDDEDEDEVRLPLLDGDLDEESPESDAEAEPEG